jgi:hypothetical protein
MPGASREVVMVGELVTAAVVVGSPAGLVGAVYGMERLERWTLAQGRPREVPERVDNG